MSWTNVEYHNTQSQFSKLGDESDRFELILRKGKNTYFTDVFCNVINFSFDFLSSDSHSCLLARYTYIGGSTYFSLFHSSTIPADYQKFDGLSVNISKFHPNQAFRWVS